MKTLCIIPARGGSKRIPRKNIRLFLGQPIIAYSIKAALESGCFDEVMVSTDDEEIAEVSIAYGAKVPFMRTKESSTDYAGTMDVLLEVLGKYEDQKVETGCCLYPCAPFVTADALKDAYAKLKAGSYDSVFPVVKYSTPIQRAYSMNNGKIKMMYPEFLNTRSQDLESAYYDPGQFYLFNVESVKKTSKLLTENTSGIVIGQERAQDIDTIEDWEMAEKKYKLLNT